MTENRQSYRQILRSSSIIGTASVLNILFGLIRIKMAAVLLGPAGVGLISLLTNLMATASTAAGLGFGNVGTRQIAEAASQKDAVAVAAVRRALSWGTVGLSLVGAGLIWLFREPLARVLLLDSSQAYNVGWLALGVWLSIAATSQSALLNGLRHIGDLARVNILGGMFGTILSVAALSYWGEKGIVGFVLAGPFAIFLFGYIYVWRLPKLHRLHTSLSEFARQWAQLARLGSAFMLAGLLGTLAQLLVRSLVQRELGPESLGHFQAAWIISMTYIGIVLQAMGADYYPRLTGIIRDHDAVNHMVNQQTEVALLLAAPMLLSMLGLAPWVIELLYSSQFQPAVDVLRWQILGDVLKVASWPLGFVILAKGDGRMFLVSESIGLFVLAALTWLGLPCLGLEATGIAFAVMYLVYLPLVYWLARRRTGFRWVPGVKRQLGLLVVASVTVLVAARWNSLTGALVSVPLSIVFAMQSLGRLTLKIDAGGSVGSIGAICRKLFMKLGVWRD